MIESDKTDWSGSLLFMHWESVVASHNASFMNWENVASHSASFMHCKGLLLPTVHHSCIVKVLLLTMHHSCIGKVLLLPTIHLISLFVYHCHAYVYMYRDSLCTLNSCELILKTLVTTAADVSQTFLLYYSEKIRLDIFLRKGK